jgi:hypothetical protein
MTVAAFFLGTPRHHGHWPKAACQRTQPNKQSLPGPCWKREPINKRWLRQAPQRIQARCARALGMDPTAREELLACRYARVGPPGAPSFAPAFTSPCSCPAT